LACRSGASVSDETRSRRLTTRPQPEELEDPPRTDGAPHRVVLIEHEGDGAIPFGTGVGPFAGNEREDGVEPCVLILECGAPDRGGELTPCRGGVAPPRRDQGELNEHPRTPSRDVEGIEALLGAAQLHRGARIVALVQRHERRDHADGGEQRAIVEGVGARQQLDRAVGGEADVETGGAPDDGLGAANLRAIVHRPEGDGRGRDVVDQRVEHVDGVERPPATAGVAEQQGREASGDDAGREIGRGVPQEGIAEPDGRLLIARHVGPHHGDARRETRAREAVIYPRGDGVEESAEFGFRIGQGDGQLGPPDDETGEFGPGCAAHIGLGQHGQGRALTTPLGERAGALDIRQYRCLKASTAQGESFGAHILALAVGARGGGQQHFGHTLPAPLGERSGLVVIPPLPRDGDGLGGARQLVGVTQDGFAESARDLVHAVGVCDLECRTGEEGSGHDELRRGIVRGDETVLRQHAQIAAGRRGSEHTERDRPGHVQRGERRQLPLGEHAQLMLQQVEDAGRLGRQVRERGNGRFARVECVHGRREFFDELGGTAAVGKDQSARHGVEHGFGHHLCQQFVGLAGGQGRDVDAFGTALDPQLVDGPHGVAVVAVIAVGHTSGRAPECHRGGGQQERHRSGLGQFGEAAHDAWVQRLGVVHMDDHGRSGCGRPRLDAFGDEAQRIVEPAGPGRSIERGRAVAMQAEQGDGLGALRAQQFGHGRRQVTLTEAEFADDHDAPAGEQALRKQSRVLAAAHYAVSPRRPFDGCRSRPSFCVIHRTRPPKTRTRVLLRCSDAAAREPLSSPQYAENLSPLRRRTTGIDHWLVSVVRGELGESADSGLRECGARLAGHGGNHGERGNSVVGRAPKPEAFLSYPVRGGTRDVTQLDDGHVTVHQQGENHGSTRFRTA
jgi:hypothetical protein